MMTGTVSKKVFRVYIEILVLISLSVIAYLFLNMVKYQSAQDEQMKAEKYAEDLKRAPQLFFEGYADEVTPEHLAELWYGDGKDKFDSLENAEKYFTDKLANAEREYYKDRSYTDENPAYRMDLDGEKTLVVTLEGKDLEWSVKEEQCFAGGSEEISVTVPMDYTVKLGGNEIDDKYIAEKDISFFPYDKENATWKYSEVLKDEILYKNIKVSGMLEELKLEITDADGNAIDYDPRNIAEDGEDTGLVSNVNSDKEYLRIAPDEVLDGKIRNFSKKFLESYLVYLTYGRNGLAEHLSAALSYTWPGSPAANSLHASNIDGISWATIHSNTRVEIIKEYDPVRWAGNCCSIDLTYHCYAMRGGEEVDYSRQDETIRIMLTDMGQGYYMIYAFELE